MRGSVDLALKDLQPLAAGKEMANEQSLSFPEVAPAPTKTSSSRDLSCRVTTRGGLQKEKKKISAMRKSNYNPIINCQTGFGYCF